MGRAPSFDVQIRLDAGARRAFALLHKLPERFRAYRKWMLYLLADQTLQGVLGYLPTGHAHASYRRALQVSRVVVPPAMDAYAVHANPKTTGVREVDPARTVVYVLPPRRRLTKPPPQVLVLRRYNPWTLDTLPFLPGRKEARIVSRQVSERECSAVSKARVRDTPRWRAELVRAGSRPSRSRKALELPNRSGETVPDIAFEALRIEFGMGGVRPVPHWRPALRDSARSLQRAALHRRADMVKLLSDPSFNGWRRWVPRLAPLRPAEAKKFQGFTQRLHIHPRGPA